MAAGGAAGLREEQRYGLSCGRLGQDHITVLHVKLTETALRALETYQSHKVNAGRQKKKADHSGGSRRAREGTSPLPAAPPRDPRQPAPGGESPGEPGGPRAAGQARAGPVRVADAAVPGRPGRSLRGGRTDGRPLAVGPRQTQPWLGRDAAAGLSDGARLGFLACWVPGRGERSKWGRAGREVSRCRGPRGPRAGAVHHSGSNIWTRWTRRGTHTSAPPAGAWDAT